MEKNDAHIQLRKKVLHRGALFLLVLFLSIGSCKKDKDEEAPDVLISLPIGFPSASVYESILLEAQISDNEKIVWIRIDVINGSNQRKINEIYIDGGDQKTVNIEEVIVLDNIYMNSGNYFIRVRAFDGENESSAFKEFQYYGLPLQTEGIYLIDSAESGSNIDYFQEESLETVNTFAADVSISEFDPFNQYLILGSESNSTLTSLSAASNEQVGSQFVLSNGADPFFTCSTYLPSENRLLAGTANGKVFSMASDGTTINFFDLLPNFRSFTLEATDQRVLVGQVSNDGSDFRLASYFLGNFVLEQSINLNFELIDVVQADDRIILVGNQDGEGIVAEYFISGNTVSILSDFSNFEEIQALGVWDNGPNLFISTSNEILGINIDQSNLSTGYTWNESAFQLEYNRAEGAMYGLNADGLFRYELFSFGTENLSNGDYDHFVIRYNKDPDY